MRGKLVGHSKTRHIAGGRKYRRWLYHVTKMLKQWQDSRGHLWPVRAASVLRPFQSKIVRPEILGDGDCGLNLPFVIGSRSQTQICLGLKLE